MKIILLTSNYVLIISKWLVYTKNSRDWLEILGYNSLKSTHLLGVINHFMYHFDCPPFSYNICFFLGIFYVGVLLSSSQSNSLNILDINPWVVRKSFKILNTCSATNWMCWVGFEPLMFQSISRLYCKPLASHCITAMWSEMAQLFNI